jgi:biotin synthase
MCYAIPGKVVSIDEKTVTVDYFGEYRKAINEIDLLKIGDYIFAQGGYVIEIVPEPEALAILSVWKEVFFTLQESDKRLSRMDSAGKNIDKKLTLILDKAMERRPVTDEEYLYLLNLENENELELLYKSANFQRQKYLGNSCCVHGILEFSNYCDMECLYCGISSCNPYVSRYRMSADEIINTAVNAIEVSGFKALVLQSGEDREFTAEKMADIISGIKKRAAALIMVSTGEVGIDGLKKMYDAGARGLLMRFETSDENLYKIIRPGHILETRLAHIRAAYDMGYLVLTGALVGIPGQKKENILNDIKLAKDLRAEMFSFGPFIPHPDTPYGIYPIEDPTAILKTLAVARLIDPENAKILVTTAFETLDKKAREKGLMAGANSVMLNVTPEMYKKSYDIYPNRAHSDEPLKKQIDETIGLLKSLGRAPTDLGIHEIK